jgi:uncharacterized protein YndB with AHSA1/START domain
MIKYSTEVSIDRPPRDVIDAHLDAKVLATWTPMVDMTYDVQGRPSVGTTGSFRLAEGPFKGPIKMRIEELDPERRVVFRAWHPAFDWTAQSTADPSGTGTRFTYSGEMRLKGWRRLLEPIMAGELRRGEAAEALRLKELLEAGGPGA